MSEAEIPDDTVVSKSVMTNDLRQVRALTLGAYAESMDFAFQESVRRLCQNGHSPSEKAFYNGWTHITAMALIWPALEGKCSPELAAAAAPCLALRNQLDVNRNVRAEVTRFLMLRPETSDNPPWIPYTNDAVLSFLQRFNQGQHKIGLCLDKRMHCLALFMDSSMCADVHSGVRDLVEEVKGDEMQEPLHATLLSSDVFAKLDPVQDADAIHKCCSTIIDDLEVFELSATYSIEYAQHDTCLVAKCRSAKLTQALGEFAEQTGGKFKPREEFSLPVWRTARPPGVFSIQKGPAP